MKIRFEVLLTAACLSVTLSSRTILAEDDMVMQGPAGPVTLGSDNQPLPAADHAPASATASGDAELRREVEALREQVRQLQRAVEAEPAQGHSAPVSPGGDVGSGMSMGGSGMGMMDDPGMKNMEKPAKAMDDHMHSPEPGSKAAGGMGHM